MAPGLYLVATPIGNARDITLRALDVLATADRLYAEDTRVTGKLLAMHAIGRPLLSYREHNARAAGERILEDLSENKSVALVSDAGSPLVSDPGEDIVQLAVEKGHPVYAIPGPSAVIAGLTASGLPATRFFFAGFLATKSAERRRQIRELEQVPATLVFYEAPGRVAETLADLAAVLGSRKAAVARELTKLHEEFRRDTLIGLAEAFANGATARGEIVIVVAPPQDEAPVVTVADLDSRLVAQLALHPVKDAAAIVAAELGLPRRTVYARALELRNAR